MNVQLSKAELDSLPVAIPVLTKRDKLLRLARLIRAALHELATFSGVEYMSPSEKRMAAHPLSVFALAAHDSVLKDAGLQGGSVSEGQRFFELSNNDLHAFSCDCGGHISNDLMAQRVEAIAARSA